MKLLTEDSTEKQLYTRLWEEHCDNVHAKRETMKELIAYNAVKQPLYMKNFSK